MRGRTNRSWKFQLPHPVRSTTNPIASDRTLITFQLTLPCGRASTSSAETMPRRYFNSRTHMGCDSTPYVSHVERGAFQFPHSTRGATKTRHFGGRKAVISIPAPHEGYEVERWRQRWHRLHFNSALHMECGGTCLKLALAPIDISIHAPREGCDLTPFRFQWAVSVVLICVPGMGCGNEVTFCV